MYRWLRWVALGLTLVGGALLIVSFSGIGDANAKEALRVSDPGVRGGPAGAGGPIAGLSGQEMQYFASSAATFAEVDSVEGQIPNEPGKGLGPGFNLNSCAGCHAFPANGGSSPAHNPQMDVARDAAACSGRCNPEQLSFLSPDGPIREVRFVRNPDGSPDGGVHDLFTISGRNDAPGCNISQPDFEQAAHARNLAFRIPTPLFGAGLIEAIPDSAILANKLADAGQKHSLGIAGHENREGNTGTITRFGWKAQNKSLLIFSGEAYNVEMGVTNEVFPQERTDTNGCTYNGVPEDHTNFDATSATDGLSDVQQFAIFSRYLAAPVAFQPNKSTVAGRQQADAIAAGKSVFTSTGCALCHTPTLETSGSYTAALNEKKADLYSDLLVHHMGSGLADGITQGNAQGDEFRTAPLWGVGQRMFFLHDGRTSDLLQAIKAHASPGSEANGVVARFYRLSTQDQENLLVFLRSL